MKLNLVVGSYPHPLIAHDRGLAVQLDELQDGPDKVIVDTTSDFAFWLQPDRPTGYGNHGDPGDLICAPVDYDGKFRLSGMCSAVVDVGPHDYDHQLPTEGELLEIENLLKGYSEDEDGE